MHNPTAPGPAGPPAPPARTQGTEVAHAHARTPGAEQFELIRRRKFPLVGDGGGVWSFIHVAGAVMMTEIRGASNARAKRELGWRPAQASWRQGFTAA